LADSNTTGTEVVEVGVDHAAVGAGAAEPDAVGAGAGDLAVFDGNVARFVRHDDGVDAMSGLIVAVAFRRQGVTGMLE
jgi:hypothetical protein